MTNKIKAKQVFDTMFEKDYFSQWMGLELLDISEGRCQLQMTVTKEMLNGFGILHGGVAFSFADSALAFASNSYGRVAVSITGQMSYSKSSKEGDILIATAIPLNVGYKTAEFDVEVTNNQTEEIFYRFRGIVYRSSKEI